MILIETHIWVWWVQGDPRLTGLQDAFLAAHESTGIGVSTITLWEVAKLVEHGRLTLPTAIEEWYNVALKYPGIQLVDLSPAIAAESTRLPGQFHADPADQIIVATSRVLRCPLVSSDGRIRRYEHVVHGP
ncbi:MAG: type II toxin-antitoxin system VapC family toxin [Deltaproteobacteria bacterium]|nr:type II toxin-antitoxin system VapC family toxin [Deltaproteobacteria bacterium]